MSKPPRASKGDTRSISTIRKNRIRFVLPPLSPASFGSVAGNGTGVALLYPYTISVHSFNLPKVGEVSKETIISPFTFDVVRLPEELERERKKAEDQVLLVMQYDMENRDEVRKKFIELREIVNDLSKKNISDSAKISRNKRLSKDVSSSTVQVLVRNPRLINDALSLAEDVLDNGVSAVEIVPTMEKLQQLRSRYNTSFEKYLIYDQNYITLRKGNYETTVRVSDVPVKEVALEEVIRKIKGTQKYDDETLNTLYELLFVYMTPNVQVNSSLTTGRREKASRDILEITGKVIKDSEIVRKHQVVTTDIVSKLKSLQLAIDRMGNYQERRRIKADNAERLDHLE